MALLQVRFPRYSSVDLSSENFCILNWYAKT